MIMVGWWAKWKWCLYFMVIFKMLIFHTTCSTITTDEKSFNHDATKHENENAEGKVVIRKNEEETEEPGNVDTSDMSDNGTEV